MGSAYTPGLRVTGKTLVHKERILPLKGDVVVKVGDAVEADTVVAETALPGDVHGVNVVNRLGISAGEIERYMLKKPGDPVTKGEPIARSTALFGLLKNEVGAPITGSIERVSDVTGQVLLRTPPKPVQVRAFCDGTISEVIEGEGVVVETAAAYIQGIFGVGRETFGAIAVAVGARGDRLTADRIQDAHRGKLVVGGSLIEYAAIEKAKKVGVAGIIAGGLRDEDLKRLLGYDLGVAITGQEDLGITIVVTEGFGAIDMAKRTFDLLKSHEGRRGSLSAATQIRAGVMRPEIVIPLGEGAADVADEKARSGELGIGQAVRCIRFPYFGRIGEVAGLPVELTQVESETWVRVLEVALDSGEKVLIPRANVELIEA